ncbi:MAG: hypothetical protein C4529_11670 [Deltaproteobacteria bacterium]|nr:MAG: hypothetical protein C4529_11670 [Deltaproteobacteria bacterium]
MSILDKETIEGRFGPLWSGRTEITVAGRARTMADIKRSFDLTGDDILAIDLHELPGGTFAFRHYDGDVRCVVVFVFDAGFDILEEHRAHIGEWLGDLYHETGALAFDPDALLHILRKKLREGSE